MLWLVPLLLGTSLCWAQKFEVASVRANVANDRIVTVQLSPDGRFTARGYTLALLLQRAYAVRYGYVLGGPGWAYSDRFDIAAKASVPGRFTEAQLRPMLVDLLAERFRLKVRTVMKEEPGYALEASRGVAMLTRSVEGEEHPDTARMTNEGFTAQGIGMATFARFLGNKLGVPVADETELPGLYDIRVRWDLPGPAANAQPGDEAADTLRAVAFRAVEEQLGLKLKPKRVGIPTVVIDYAEKPRESDN
ncbi:MAG: hypothetical protein JWN34_1871 [Bryobacterales bacterium]|nr:hypothetical protein [Bryobacterales bacterium]